MLPTTHPYLLVVRQSVLERAVEEALHQKHLKVLWRHRLESLDADGATLQAEVATLDQVATGYPIARSEWVVSRREAIRPRYVIGADGYDSAVRRMAGIEMVAHGKGQVFSVYEIEAAGALPDEVRVVLDPDLTSVYWPLEEGRCRWGFQIEDSSRHAASTERLEQLIAERAPWWTARPTETYWSTLALFESRLARSFGTGAVWLAGDAAHQAAPVAVQSMNSGLVEARELAARISRIQRAGGAPSLLEEFAAETHRSWQGLLGASSPPGAPDAAGSPGGGEVRALPGADSWVQENRARILRLCSGLGRRSGIAAPADRPHGPPGRVARRVPFLTRAIARWYKRPLSRGPLDTLERGGRFEPDGSTTA